MNNPGHSSKPNYLPPVISHFDRLLSTGLADYGPSPSRMWMSSLDILTGRYPIDDSHPPEIGKRVYRNIDAPKGCSLYWDQSSLVGAYAISAITAQEKYANAADSYVADFLERCVAKTGIILWGNHYYYQVASGAVMKFHAEEDPIAVDVTQEEGELHETRPIPPAWELFWNISPEKTQRAIWESAKRHLVDTNTGEFNRHAEGSSGCSFPEAGGILVQSLAWLYQKNGDPACLEIAKKNASFSFGYRHPQTGLLEINPTWRRWDKITSTTEVGLWAGCLLNASRWASVPEWIEMADQAVTAWLKYGYNHEHKKYYGRLTVQTGHPIFGTKETPYQPGDFSDLWEPLFPAHDYPMQFAEACLKLFEITGKSLYRLACRRWAEVIDLSLPARKGKGGYAEHYGRCIHFCLGCWLGFEDLYYLSLAHRLAEEAMRFLFVHGMFRGHPGEDRYDAVDGVGFLALALIELSSGQSPDGYGLTW